MCSSAHESISSRFSILWVDRGGETYQEYLAVVQSSCFSILWVDRGGVTL